MSVTFGVLLMRTHLLMVFGLFLIAVAAAGGQGRLEWFHDFEKGKKIAAETDKILLVSFTGSSWFPPCQLLEDEVFSQKEFVGADEHYVLVKLDFPSLDEEVGSEWDVKQLEKTNALAIQLDIVELPTIVLFDQEGRAFARTGYLAGGPENYLAHLAEIAKPFIDFKNAKGEERKEALVTFLKSLRAMEVEETFSEEYGELKELDPEDKSGLVAQITASKAMATFEDGIAENLAVGEFAVVLKLVDDFLVKHNPQGEQRQHVLMGRVMVYVEQGDGEKAFAEIDQMIGFAPESEFSQNVEEIKKSITEHLEFRARLEAETGLSRGAVSETPGIAEEAESTDNEESALNKPQSKEN